MSDNKEAEQVAPTSVEETKKAGTDAIEKTEDTADSGSTTEQSRPPRQLPTHYKGMPKQWEKNQVPKKDT